MEARDPEVVVGGGLHDIQHGIDALVVPHSAEEETVQVGQQNECPRLGTQRRDDRLGARTHTELQLANEPVQGLSLLRVTDGSVGGDDVALV